MSQLLNEANATYDVVEYDRSYGGSFNNPYGGVPSINFAMQRIAIKTDDNSMISVKPLPGFTEPYVTNKVYQMYNPLDGNVIAGATFTSDQLYAMLYSMMISCCNSQSK